MEIPEKLLKFKYHFIFGALASLVLVALIQLAPRFVTVLAYFWPLLVSTALFLVAVVVFGRISPTAADGAGEKTGEGLLDYVAGHPQGVEEPPKSE
uniref:Uncharacterized protein n=1 Tax=Nelumbo nucifera TaxID=4432 RepID=A0A822XUI5_NELNU|nr:TPA_asm: hypothetical protein HUJ06_025115 [Nelumbo nucifera]